MKRNITLAIFLSTLSFGSIASVEIPRDRVVCDNEASMSLHLKRKDNRNFKMTEGCRKLEMKRIGNVENLYPGRGFAKVKTKMGGEFFVDIDAVRK